MNKDATKAATGAADFSAKVIRFEPKLQGCIFYFKNHQTLAFEGSYINLWVKGIKKNEKTCLLM